MSSKKGNVRGEHMSMPRTGGVHPASGSSSANASRNTRGATKPKPPPNAAPKQSNTNSNCIPCQKATVKACDVDTLEIKAEKEGEGEVRVLKASKKMRQALNATEKKTYPAHIHKHLENFDIIVDCVAGFKDNYFKATSAPTIQQLSAEATFHRAGRCPKKHPKLSAKVASGNAERVAGNSKGKSAYLGGWGGDNYDDEDIKGAKGNWPKNGEERRFLANPVFGGNAKEPNDFTALFYLIFALMDAQNPKLVQVVAEGDGVRTDGKPVRVSLRGLFRIYREDVIKISVASKGEGRENHREPAERGAASSEDAAALATYKANASGGTPGKPVNAAAKQTSKPPKQGFVDFVKTAKPTAPGTSIKVTINDDEVKIDAEKAKKLASLMGKLSQLRGKPSPIPGAGMVSLGIYLAALWDLSVMTLRKRFRDILTMLRNCVKYGLWLDLDFGWLDGAIGFKYATKAGKDYPRYKSIVHGWSFYCDVDLFRVEFSMNFGVKADFGSVAAVWAYVFVKLSGKLTIGFETSIDSEGPGTAKVEGIAEPELGVGATGGAKLLGMGVSVNAEAKVKLTVKASIETTFGQKKPKLETSGTLNPIVLDYQAQVHAPGLPARKSGQWHPWGPAKNELWKHAIQ